MEKKKVNGMDAWNVAKSNERKNVGTRKCLKQIKRRISTQAVAKQNKNKTEKRRHVQGREGLLWGFKLSVGWYCWKAAQLGLLAARKSSHPYPSTQRNNKNGRNQ